MTTQFSELGWSPFLRTSTTLSGCRGRRRRAGDRCGSAPPTGRGAYGFEDAGVGGLEATAQITVHHPDTAVVVLTMDSDHDSVFAALRAGARGHLLKEADGDDVQRALHAVSKGEAVFGPGIAKRVISFFATPRLATVPAPFPQ